MSVIVNTDTPSFVSNITGGKVTLLKVQEIVGDGSPVAEQVNVTVWPTEAIMEFSGFSKILGGEGAAGL